MLDQFRSLYPQGSILSELITIHHDKYIVRVLIKSENLTLASSLAAAETVEKAEDQARNRALTLLNLEKNSLLPNNNTVTSFTKKNYSSLRNIQKETQKSEPKIDIFIPESPVISLEEKNGNTDEAIEIPNQEQEEISLDIEEKEEERELGENFFNSDDFSDLVAKTNLELTRLGWTNEQGRDYLLQTYGKRSRQLLNHEELREFLHYLEQQ